MLWISGAVEYYLWISRAVGQVCFGLGGRLGMWAVDQWGSWAGGLRISGAVGQMCCGSVGQLSIACGSEGQMGRCAVDH